MGTMLDTTTSLLKKLSKPSDFGKLESHFSSLTQGTHTNPSDLSGWSVLFYLEQCRQGFQACDIVELRLKMDDGSTALMTGFVDNVAYKPKSGRHSAPSFFIWCDTFGSGLTARSGWTRRYMLPLFLW